MWCAATAFVSTSGKGWNNRLCGRLSKRIGVLFLLLLEPAFAGGAIGRYAGTIRIKYFGGFIEQYVINRITYAASYELLKRFVCKNKLNIKQLEDISIVRTDCQVCDPIILHHCGKWENPYNGDNSKMRKGTGSKWWSEQYRSSKQTKRLPRMYCVLRHTAASVQIQRIRWIHLLRRCIINTTLFSRQRIWRL